MAIKTPRQFSTKTSQKQSHKQQPPKQTIASQSSGPAFDICFKQQKHTNATLLPKRKPKRRRRQTVGFCWFLLAFYQVVFNPVGGKKLKLAEDYYYYYYYWLLLFLLWLFLFVEFSTVRLERTRWIFCTIAFRYTHQVYFPFPFPINSLIQELQKKKLSKKKKGAVVFVAIFLLFNQLKRRLGPIEQLEEGSIHTIRSVTKTMSNRADRVQCPRCVARCGSAQYVKTHLVAMRSAPFVTTPRQPISTANGAPRPETVQVRLAGLRQGVWREEKPCQARARGPQQVSCAPMRRAVWAPQPAEEARRRQASHQTSKRRKCRCQAHPLCLSGQRVLESVHIQQVFSVSFVGNFICSFSFVGNFVGGCIAFCWQRQPCWIAGSFVGLLAALLSRWWAVALTCGVLTVFARPYRQNVVVSRCHLWSRCETPLPLPPSRSLPHVSLWTAPSI